ncbi:hypothetical protein [Streptacidiphilus anmyonensis]|uniref:hypothetical protein n=1 Tax=Streptacidiphilus anmyonensis TaxID=405782 RepID=UPI0005AB3922|nr:hypothetical protein [Streptacidiphilus anmyonensis]
MTVLEREDGVVSGIGRVDGALELGDGWAVRLAQGSRGRLALEVYADERLLDVVVENALTAELLRGARRAAAGASVLAWGLLPADGAAPQVRFGRAAGSGATSGAVTSGGAGAGARVVAGRFWVAFCAAGTDRVAVAAGVGTPWEELRVTQVR